MKSVACICILIFLLNCSCSKDVEYGPYATVSVRFLGDEDDVFFEIMEVSWEISSRTARVSAQGFAFEEFYLYLPGVLDTGYYPNPTIQNISFSDGIDFKPFKVAGGYIHVDYFDSVIFRARFQVGLEDDFNGTEYRTIIGACTINQ